MARQFITRILFSFLFIGLLANDEPSTNEQISVKADYSIVNSTLSCTFPVFYGYIHENLDQFCAKIDFYYDKSILISDDLNPKGITCSQDFLCAFKDKVSFIVENINHNLISVHEAGAPIYLSPFLGSLSPYALPKFQFYLNSADGHFTDINSIGIKPGSDFWPYLSLAYRASRVFIMFQTSFTFRNTQELVASPLQIETQLVLFPKLNQNLEYQAFGVDELVAKGVTLSIKGLDIVLEAVFSYDDPMIFRTCEMGFGKVVSQLNQIICVNPSKCETRNDLFVNFSVKDKLSIIFPSNVTDFNARAMTVEFSAAELFDLDTNDNIVYNFGKYLKKSDRQSSFVLGLLFLRKVNLLIQYHDSTNSFDLFLQQKAKPECQILFQMFTLFSLVFSLFTSCFLIWINKFPKLLETFSIESESLTDF